MFQAKFVEKIKTNILCTIIFFQQSCHILDNKKKYDSDGSTIWHQKDANFLQDN